MNNGDIISTNRYLKRQLQGKKIRFKADDETVFYGILDYVEWEPYYKSWLLKIERETIYSELPEHVKYWRFVLYDPNNFKQQIHLFEDFMSIS